MNVANRDRIQSRPLPRLASYLILLAVLCFFWGLGGCSRDEGLPMPVGIDATALPESVSEGAQLTALFPMPRHTEPDKPQQG